MSSRFRALEADGRRRGSNFDDGERHERLLSAGVDVRERRFRENRCLQLWDGVIGDAPPCVAWRP